MNLQDHICFKCKNCFKSTSDSGDSLGMSCFTSYFCSVYDCSADPFPDILKECESYGEIE